LILEGVCRSLVDAPNIRIVGEAHDGRELLPLVNRLQPDVVLLDIRMPKLDGLTALELIRDRHRQVRVVIFSASADEQVIEAALRRGASGYILKTIDLPSALRQTVCETFFTMLAPSCDAPANQVRDAGLTERELTILVAVSRGLSNRAIGNELWVTEQTVKFHLTNIYRKLGVANRTEAARVAYQLGIGDNPASSMRLPPELPEPATLVLAQQMPDQDFGKPMPLTRQLSNPQNPLNQLTLAEQPGRKRDCKSWH
jgi:DNA-binding NarL/FixJ family response regulator